MLNWKKVSAARNVYYSKLGEATSKYNNSVFDALEAYNKTVLDAEIARAKAHFDAVESYSKDSYDLEAKYVKAQFETNKKSSLAALDAAIVQVVGLAELDAYYARKTADEYSTITVDDELLAARNQIDDTNRLVSNQKRQEINDSKTATDKANNKQAKRDSNNDYTEYFEAWLALQTTYELAIATANETYYDTVTTAEVTAITTIILAENNYNNSVELSDAQFNVAMVTIDSSNDISTGYFNATATTSNTVNNVQQNGNNNNNSNNSSSNSGILNRIKGFWGKIQYYANHYNDVKLGSIHDLPNKNLGNVPINPETLATKMKLQQRINASAQIADYTNNVADGIEVAVFVAGMFLPGPDDIFWGYVTSKYGIKLVTESGSRLLYRNGEKLSGEALNAAEEILTRMKIVQHTKDRKHFRGKSLEQLDNLLQTTVKNAKSQNNIFKCELRPNSTLYHDKSTGIIVIYDGKGSGSMYKPQNIKTTIDGFINGNIY
jgi:hypothetical protein